MCFYDRGQKRHRQCARATLGMCDAYKGPCAPKAKCQIDPKEGLYRQCLEAAPGVCKRFGDLCSP